MPEPKIKGFWGSFLNWMLKILQGFKNAGLFKRGNKPEDIVPGMKDPRDRSKR